MTTQAKNAVTYAEVTEGEDIVTRVYVASHTAVAITAEKVTGWGLSVTEVSPDKAPVEIHSLSNVEPVGFFQVAPVIDGGWTKNDVGYTFIHRLLNSNVQFRGLRTYVLQYSFRTFDYGQIYATKHLTVVPSPL